MFKWENKIFGIPFDFSDMNDMHTWTSLHTQGECDVVRESLLHQIVWKKFMKTLNRHQYYDVEVIKC